MFDRTSQSKRLVGSGPSKLRQLIEDIAKKEGNKTAFPIMWATVVRDGAIKLDNDQYEILSESDYITLNGSHYSTGDRVLVAEIDNKRGQILILGRPSPIQTVASFYSPGHIEYFDPTGATTATDPGGSASVTVSKSLSSGWLLPASRIRAVGRTVRNGGSGACTVEVVDEQNGVIGSQVLAPDGDFDITIDRDDITDDDLNIVSIRLTYNDAVANTATISRTTMLLGEP